MQRHIQPLSFCGRRFSPADLELIAEVLETCSGLSRAELGATVCELLEWKRPSGRLKSRECRDLLELLQEQDLIELPEKGNGRPAGLSDECGSSATTKQHASTSRDRRVAGMVGRGEEAGTRCGVGQSGAPGSWRGYSMSLSREGLRPAMAGTSPSA